MSAVSVQTVALGGFVAALQGAARIDLCAYILPPGAVRAALVAAAGRGAAVRVRLAAEPFHDARGALHRANAAAVQALRAAGADAALAEPAAAPLHLKAAVVDGVAWLDDRNWAGAQSTVIRDDDPADVAVVREALAGRPAADDHLATTKAGAEALELAAIAAAGSGPVAVATESFGGGAVAGALMARARAGEPTRLLVCGRARSTGEDTLLRHLAAAGVEVRTGSTAEKLAVGADAAWVGSANATYAGSPYGAERDWGMLVRDRPAVDALRAAFEGDWQTARPLGGVTPPAERTALPPSAWSPLRPP
jgi:phosphatidylserine/phosphatidylglycerophosphate/cardiolipin synthase-like enzyme